MSETEIDKISLEILKNSKSLGIFPTPVEAIVEHVELQKKQCDLTDESVSIFEILRSKTKGQVQNLLKGLEKVKGIFSREEKVIYLNLSDKTNRKNFVTLHEVGHGVLPWQNEISLALDDSQTLSLNFEDQFENEANHFAAITLFQHHVFLDELDKLPLGIKSGMALAKKFGSSTHAALRNYVIKSKNKCGLLVIESNGEKGFGKPFCKTRNLFLSESFFNEYGNLDLPEEFGYTWEFAKNFKFGRRYLENGKIDLPSRSGERIKCDYHYFHNYYNGFVFFFPKGEKKSSRKKIILSE